MALPTSGNITIQMIATELGLSLPLDLNDSRVRTLAGKPSGSITMPGDFYGKSSVTATATITGSMSQQRQGGTTSTSRRSIGVFGVTTSSGAVPSAYSWSIIQDDAGAGMFLSGATSSQCTCNGPVYDINGEQYISTFVLQCIATVDGNQVTATRSLNYTYGIGI